jgi:hypothetical protein
MQESRGMSGRPHLQEGRIYPAPTQENTHAQESVVGWRYYIGCAKVKRDYVATEFMVAEKLFLCACRYLSQ